MLYFLTHRTRPAFQSHMRFLIFFLISMAMSHAEPLTEVDLKALKKKIEELENDKSRLNTRFNTAIKKLKGVVRSDTASYELYINSVQKVRFEDEHRKPAVFREWKKRNQGVLKDKNFHQALRYRYQWLLFTLKSSRSGISEGEMTVEANDILTRFLKDAPKIIRFYQKSDNQLLKDLQGPVLSGVVAQAYGVERIKMDESWPQTLLPIENIFENIIMPPLRNADKLKLLASAWDRRVLYEKQLTESLLWGEDKEEANRDPNGGFDRFVSRKMPDLLWKKEVDLFKSGDQRAAAKRMFDHIEKHISSPDAVSWLEQYKVLVFKEKP